MTFDLQIDVPFHGIDNYELLNTVPSFGCSIKFEGNNVIDGFKELAELGYCATPMKPHLSTLSKLCQDHLKVRPKHQP